MVWGERGFTGDTGGLWVGRGASQGTQGSWAGDLQVSQPPKIFPCPSGPGWCPYMGVICVHCPGVEVGLLALHALLGALWVCSVFQSGLLPAAALSSHEEPVKATAA